MHSENNPEISAFQQPENNATAIYEYYSQMNLFVNTYDKTFGFMPVINSEMRFCVILFLSRYLKHYPLIISAFFSTINSGEKQ